MFRYPLALGASFLLTASATAQSAPLVLRGATVIDGTDRAPLPDAVIVIRNGWIAAVGSRATTPTPKGARVVDLGGRFVVPGFVDMHSHIAIGTWVLDTAGGRRALRYHYDEAATRELARTQLAFGITTLRNPAGPTQAAIRIRDRIREGEQDGPRIFTAGPPLDAAGQDSAQVKVTTEAEVRAEVARQAAAGVDIIKLYAGLTAPLVRAGVDEAHRLGLQAIIHCWQTTWTDAALAGVDGITHIAPGNGLLLPEAKRADFQKAFRGTQFMFDWFRFVDFDSPEINTMLDAMVSHRVDVDPTLVAFEAMAWADSATHFAEANRYLPPSLANQQSGEKVLTMAWKPADFAAAKAVWPTILAFTKRLHDAGVLLTVGTDGANPWYFQRELELLVAAGIPPAEVIRMATRNAAIALGRPSLFGTVEAGKRADLIVLSADPTVEIGNARRIEWVVQSGRVSRPSAFLPARLKMASRAN